MKLYDINQEMDRIMSLTTESGELPDDVYEQLMQLSLAEGAKIENIGLWIKNMAAESDAIKNETDNLLQRRKAIDNRIESTKSFIGCYLKQTHRSRIETLRVVLSLRSSTAVVLDNESIIPQQYYIPQEPKFSKDDIKRDLKLGVEVPGARLETRQNVQVK